MSTVPQTEFEKHEQFKEGRALFVGGSDIGSILGVGDWACELRVFNDKTGVVKTNPFFGSAATERGNDMEEFTAHKYGQLLNRQVRKAVPKAHKLYPRLRPQSDYEIVNVEGITAQFPNEQPIVLDGSYTPGVISIKVPDPRSNTIAKIKYEGMPEAYILQLMYELACWGRNWGSFAVYDVASWKLIPFDVRYDPELGEAAVKAALKFIEEHWDANVAPPKLDKVGKACMRCEYLTGCQHDTLMSAAFEEEGLVFPYVEDPVLALKLAKVAEARMLKSEAEALVEEAIADVQPLIADKTYFECPNPNDPAMKMRVYFREQKGRESFKWGDAKKAFAKDDELMTKLKKFVSISKPSRPLRIYDIPVR